MHMRSQAQSSLSLERKMVTLEDFPIPEELQLFINDGLAEEVVEFEGLKYDKSTVRMWSLKGTEFHYFMSGINLTSVGRKIYIDGIITNWVDDSLKILPAKEVFDGCGDSFELTRVFVSRPDVYFANDKVNRKTKLEDNS